MVTSSGSDGSCKNSRGIRSLTLASSLAMVKVIVGMELGLDPAKVTWDAVDDPL